MPLSKGSDGKYLTNDMILNEAMFQYKNNLVACREVYRSLEQKVVNGTGGEITVKKPFRVKSTEGRAIGKQSLIDNSVSLVINRQQNIGLEFTVEDRSLSIQQFSERYIMPSIGQIATQIDLSVLKNAAESTYFHSGTVGQPLDHTTVMFINADVNNVAIPDDNMRVGMVNERDGANISSEVSKVFNEKMVDGAIKKGYMGDLSGFRMNKTQLVPTHTVGNYSGTPLVAGASQSGSSITTDGWTASVTGLLKKGDLITFDGVYEINPVTYESTGRLQTFVLTNDVNSDAGGLATLPISPSLNDGTGTVLDGDGNAISDSAYQNISNLPADNATITVLGDANGIYRQNFFWHKNAIALAMVDLYLPESASVAIRVRDKDTGLSLSLTKDYTIDTHKEVTRIDALWGVKMMNPELIFKTLTEKIN